jgi:hypothetical protein
LGAKNMAEMMRGVALHDGRGPGELFDEESAAHA